VPQEQVEIIGAMGRREGVQVIERAAAMLRALASDPEGLTLVELASRVGLPRSTAHRIVRALSHEDFVLTSPSGRLRIGPALIGLAVSSRLDLRHEVSPFLERLSHEVHETVDLAVLEGREVLFIDQHTSRRALRIVAEVGSRFPLHSTANGKALLAALAPEKAAELLPERLTAMTVHTTVDRHALLAEIDEIRRTGLAFDLEEQTIGIAAIGTTVRDASGAFAAVTVVVPVGRFLEHKEQIAKVLLRTRDEITTALRGE
jgi:DNA-binding IclR family transcriptional regulator